MIVSVKEHKFMINGYEITKTDGSVWDVPPDAGNADYQAVQDWIEAGGTVEPKDS